MERNHLGHLDWIDVAGSLKGTQLGTDWMEETRATVSRRVCSQATFVQTRITLGWSLNADVNILRVQVERNFVGTLLVLRSTQRYPGRHRP
jgi:hypothetical protein